MGIYGNGESIQTALDCGDSSPSPMTRRVRGLFPVVIFGTWD